MQTYQDVTQQISRLEHDRLAIKNEIDKYVLVFIFQDELFF